MKIVNQNTGAIIAERAIIADNMFSRMKGLLGRKNMEKGEAIVLKPCNSIHTFFMAFSIDVIFVDNSNTVVRLFPAIPPWRMTPFIKASYCIEMPSGSANSLLKQGDLIKICL